MVFGCVICGRDRAVQVNRGVLAVQNDRGVEGICLGEKRGTYVRTFARACAGGLIARSSRRTYEGVGKNVDGMEEQYRDGVLAEGGEASEMELVEDFTALKAYC